MEIVFENNEAKKVDEANNNVKCGASKKKEWNVGDLCVVQWWKDEVWYKILDVNEDNVWVVFTDYGN